MSFKSYAQGGQFSTYHIDLPIKAEINDDLRAAGDFAKQMQRSQKYREKWASSYLSALNEKSSIERQNRDDNFEFLQNNFKRIYEGEQREFEGRVAELQREQAKRRAKEAEPGTLEKIFNFASQALGAYSQVIGAVGQMNALQSAANQERTSQILHKVQSTGYALTPSELNSANNILTSALPPGAPLDLHEQIVVARSREMGITPDEFNHLVQQTGKDKHFRDLTLLDNVLPQVTTAMAHEAVVGSGRILDPKRPEYHNNVRGYDDALRKNFTDAEHWFYGGPLDVSDKASLEKLNKAQTSFFNQAHRTAKDAWGTQSRQIEQQHLLLRSNQSFGDSVGAANWFKSLVGTQMNIQGTTPGQAFGRAFMEMNDLVLRDGSTVSAAQYLEATDHILREDAAARGIPQHGKHIKDMIRDTHLKLLNKEATEMTNANKRTTTHQNNWFRGLEDQARQLTTQEEKNKFWADAVEGVGGVEDIKSSNMSQDLKTRLLGNVQGQSRATKGKDEPWKADRLPEEYFKRGADGLFPLLEKGPIQDKYQIESAKAQVVMKAKELYPSIRAKYPDLNPVQWADKALVEAKESFNYEYENIDADGAVKDALKPVTIKNFGKEDGGIPTAVKHEAIRQAVSQNPNATKDLEFAPGVNTPDRRRHLKRFNDSRLLFQGEGGMEIPNQVIQRYITPEIRLEAKNAGESVSQYLSNRLEAHGYKPLHPDNVATQEELARAGALGKRAGSGYFQSSQNDNVWRSINHGTYAPTTSYPNMNMSYIPGTSSNRTEWGSLPQQFWPFATKYYNAAERMGAPFPELVLAQAIHETGGGVAPHSVYMSSGKTNPFGQTGEGTAGSFPDDRVPGRVWARYNTPDEAVAKHIEYWQKPYQHYPGVQPGDTPMSYLKSIIQQYAPAGEGENSGYVAAVEKYLRQMGFDPNRPYQPKPDPTFSTGMPSNYKGGHSGTPTKKKFLGLI